MRARIDLANRVHDARQAGVLETRILESQEELLQWDIALRDNPQGHYRQANWWLESLRRMGIEFFVLAVQRDGVCLGGAGVLEFSIPLVNRPVLIILNGPVFFDQVIPATRAFAAALERESQSRNAILTQIEGVPQTQVFDTLRAPWASHRLTLRRLWHLYTNTERECRVALDDVDTTRLMGSFSESTRRKIRKAEKAGVRIVEVRTPEEFRAVHRTWQMSGSRKGFTVRPFEGIGTSMEMASQLQSGDVYAAKLDDQIIAGIFVGYGGKEATYISGGFNHHLSQVSPNPLLHFHAMQRAQERGMSAYNLGHYGHDSLSQFKRGFRPEVVELTNCLTWIRSPRIYSLIVPLIGKRASHIIRKIIRRKRGFANEKS